MEVIILFGFIAFLIYVFAKGHSRYKELSNMDPEELKKLMKNEKSDDRINPATGLHMIGSMDSYGNPYGTDYK